MNGKVAVFRQGNAEESADSEKLLNLYWNRAELKKALAQAKDDSHKLTKQLAERDGSIARLEQKLKQLEDLLIDPEWVHAIGVHYQLRALNKRCIALVARFAEQLKQQQEKRQHQALLDSWNSKRSSHAKQLSGQLAELGNEKQRLDQEVLRLREEHEGRNALSRFFGKRRLKKKISDISEARAVLCEREDALDAKLAEIEDTIPPDQQGLARSAKRSINFMILSFAQQLYIAFNDDNLAALVKEAGDKSAGALKYGDKQECDRILDEINARWTAFDNIMESADTIQQRAKLLSEKAMFMGDDDVVPVAGSVATLIHINDGGAVSQRNANLLGENYWRVENALSR